MKTIGIVGNGPLELHPDYQLFMEEIDIWIGADRGALTLAENNIPIEYAVGDFDSINEQEQSFIQRKAVYFKKYPVEKNETDLEIALSVAYMLQPSTIYLFGVTGGRLDHELVNIQLLFSIIKKGGRGIVIDQSNLIEMTMPGVHTINHNEVYPNISFIPFTQQVKALTLSGFYYPLEKENISWGSTRCISNKLLLNNGTFSYEEGILLVLKSRDAIPK
ncbi:thiamine pyrophosphokinase [Virgibacillus halotolerans]|uniref:thiamine diphosphokinase n=1 Tax=Virgibacillus halotolerans TaxID=1071053 RepID=UPI00195F614E|nr:thiamine diphosphokinase [Virgibacillus halotolerans]MBM7598640.1 thiamine pyrophosphokinase [Virgibacillus halotolerans]